MQAVANFICGMSMPAEQGSKRQGHAMISERESKRIAIDGGIERYPIELEGTAAKQTLDNESNFLWYYPLSNEIRIEFGERSQWFEGLQQVCVIQRSNHWAGEGITFDKNPDDFGKNNNVKRLDEFFISIPWKLLCQNGSVSLIHFQLSPIAYVQFVIPILVEQIGDGYDDEYVMTMCFNTITEKPNMNINDKERRLIDEIRELQLNHGLADRATLLLQKRAELTQLHGLRDNMNAFAQGSHNRLGLNSQIYGLPPQGIRELIAPYVYS